MRIVCKVSNVVTDHASNMTVTTRLADLMYLMCFAHTLNLAFAESTEITNSGATLRHGQRC